MTDEQYKRIAGITNANRQIKEIYALLDELGITYKRTGCSRCRRDLLNILREEAGLISSAAEASEFDAPGTEYTYLPDRPQSWNGHLMDQDTPVEIIREFVKQFPTGYYRKMGKPQTADTEEIINNQE